MKKLPRNNKRGVTLVEVVIGVFVLSIFALGILFLLIYNNQAVADSARDKRDYSAATQKLDMILAAVSNSLGPRSEGFDPAISYLKEKEDASDSIEIDEMRLRTDFELDNCELSFSADGDPLRGWYITLTYTVARTERGEEVEYKTVVVKGYASFAEGAFDK